MYLTRREFLVAGAVAGAMGPPVWSLPQVRYAGTGDGAGQPTDRRVMTLCRQCPGGCGLRIREVDGHVVGVAGNPSHPINRGGVCARAPASVQTLYNPDRLSRPAVLAGPKGSGEYRPVAWPEATELLGDRLRRLRQAPGPHGLAVLLGGDRGLARLLWSRFLQAYGSNNLIDWSFPEGHEAYPVIWAMQGLKRAIGYDLAGARFVLSFGSQLLDAHWSPTQASAAFAALRGGEQAHRPRFVHVEPRLSITGAKADEWVPIRPGTEGALALGLAHVLLREGLYDRQFVEQLTHGFDDPAGDGVERIGFRRLVLRDYAPSRVAQITGVDSGTIFRLAREFASNRPALALGYDGSGVSTQRCYDRMAIHALNALVGSLDVPGGITHFQELRLLREPMPQPDAPAERGLSRPRIDEVDGAVYPLGGNPDQLLAERILADLPYPVEVLVIAGGNPVFDSPHPERMRQALAKVPFVVSLSPWLDDTARWADLIVPETHFLASWDVDVGHTLTGMPTVTIGRPVVAPDPAARSSADLVLELARNIGDPVSTALPYSSPEAVVHAICDRLYDFGRGGPFGSTEEVEWTRLLERSGWRPPPASSPEAFRRMVLDAGGWTDPIYYHQEWERVFRAPPRRFAFHSTVIADRILPRSAEDDVRCLPHFEPVQTDGRSTFPLQLYVYPLAMLAGLTEVNIPWVVDACGSVMSQRWESWVEINPATAEPMHISDGDAVVLTSPRGQITTRARLFEGIRPDVVAMPWGLGHEGGGRWINGVGQHPAALVDVKTDPLTAGAYWNATPVSLQRA